MADITSEPLTAIAIAFPQSSCYQPQLEVECGAGTLALSSEALKILKDPGHILELHGHPFRISKGWSVR